MKLSRHEQSVLSLLRAAARPQSVSELAERCSFRPFPVASVVLALDGLRQKGLVREAEIHASYSGGRTRRYLAYAPVSGEKEENTIL